MPTADSTRQLKFGAILSYSSVGLNILINLLYTPWLIRSIGKGDYGLYTLSLSVITFFIFDFGLSSAVTRFIATYLAEGKKEHVNNCLGMICKIYLFIDIVILLFLTAFYFFIPAVYRQLSGAEIEKFKVIYVISALFSSVSFLFIPLNGILNAHEKFIQLKICDVCGKLLTVGMMSICLLMGYGLYALVLTHAVSGLVVILLKLICLKKYTPLKINIFYYDRKELFSILSYSSWVTVIIFAYRCIFSIAPSILGYLSGTASIAVFGLAVTLEGFIYTFASSWNGMFLAKVSRLTTQDCSGLLPLMIKVGRIQILILGLIFIGFALLGRDFIHLWVGQDFSLTYPCTLLLIFPIFLQTPQEIATVAIATTNNIRFQAMVSIIIAVLNVVLSFVFGAKWGALGIATAICTSLSLQVFGMNVIYRNVLKIELGRFYWQSFGKLLIPLLLAGVLGCLLCRFWPANRWITLVAKGAFFALGYGVIMLFWMNQSEKDLLFAPLKKIFKRS